MKLRRFSDEIMNELGRLSEIVVRESGASDAFAQKVYDSYLAARKDSSDWSKISEEGFLRARRATIDPQSVDPSESL